MKRFSMTIAAALVYVVYLEIYLFGSLNHWHVNQWWHVNAIVLAVAGWIPAMVLGIYEK